MMGVVLLYAPRDDPKGRPRLVRACLYLSIYLPYLLRIYLLYLSFYRSIYLN